MENFPHKIEQSENELYLEFKAAEIEVEKVLKEIEAVYAANPSRKEAEKIILATLSSKLSEKLVESRQAMETWLKGIQESI